MSELHKGLYRHYRKGVYRVIGVATNHDTQEKTVIYHPELDPDTLWSRPLDEFTSIINLVDHGRSVDRFTYLGP